LQVSLLFSLCAYPLQCGAYDRQLHRFIYSLYISAFLTIQSPKKGLQCRPFLVITNSAYCNETFDRFFSTVLSAFGDSRYGGHKLKHPQILFKIRSLM